MTDQTLDYSARINTYGKACTACGTGFLSCVETVLAGERACCRDCGRLDRPDTHSSVHESRLAEAQDALKSAVETWEASKEEYRAATQPGFLDVPGGEARYLTAKGAQQKALNDVIEARKAVERFYH